MGTCKPWLPPSALDTAQQKPRGHCGRGLAGAAYVEVGKETLEAPGRNVGAKAGLNKAILDQGWGTFRHMLEYKQLPRRCGRRHQYPHPWAAGEAKRLRATSVAPGILGLQAGELST
jgi:hypothetical protein